jgi:hypothetical protein
MIVSAKSLSSLFGRGFSFKTSMVAFHYLLILEKRLLPGYIPVTFCSSQCGRPSTLNFLSLLAEKGAKSPSDS